MTTSIPPVATTSTPSKEFVVLAALLMSITALTIDALLPALGVIGADLAVENPNSTQLLISSVFIGLACGQLLAGPLSDALGRKPVLYTGIGFYLSGSLFSYFAPTLELLLVGRVIQGFGIAGPYVSSVSIVRDRYSGRSMARVMSLIMMIFMVVPAIAPSFGQAVMYIATWREIFLLYIIHALIIGTWIFLRLEETLPPEKRAPLTFASMRHGFREVTRNRVTMSCTLCAGIIFGSFIGYLNSSQQIFQVQFDTGEMFNIYFGVLAFVLGIASHTNSRFVQRYGMHYICTRSFASIVGISIIFLAAHAVVDIRLWMFLVYAVLLFFSFGLVFGNLNAMAMEPMGHIAGIASSIVGAGSSLISMTIGTSIGQLYDNTLVPVVTGFVFLGIIAFALLQYAERARKAARAAQGFSTD